MNKCNTHCSSIPMFPNHLINIYIMDWQTMVCSLNTARWPVFVKKVSLEHSHVHVFIHYLWLLLCYNGIVKLLRLRLYDLQSLKYLLFNTLQKMFANLW